ncbi:MAG: esterase-like activity of phytase family protein [Sediminibacterium sp.]
MIGVYELPHNLPFKGTTVGGLSGIDYDPALQVYHLISDDRSAINPARFYTAKIYFSDRKIDSVVMVNVTTLLQQNGRPYPDSKHDPVHTPDPEALRYNPVTRQMIWTSEGERIVKEKDTVLENPAITIIAPDGKYIDTFPLPWNLRMHATENGPRQNGVLEGLSFADDFKTLYVSLEEPRYEDGPRAGIKANAAWTRIYKFDVLTRANKAQYAYELDPVAYPPATSGAFMINGIPDILSAGKEKLLVMERSFSAGRLACTIKIFMTDLGRASDVSHINSLKDNPPARPAAKRLLLNMDSLGIYVDNVEGMSFGPDLPNGHRTLLLVTDNNFAALERTQFFLFEVIP